MTRRIDRVHELRRATAGPAGADRQARVDAAKLTMARLEAQRGALETELAADIESNVRNTWPATPGAMARQVLDVLEDIGSGTRREIIRYLDALDRPA